MFLTLMEDHRYNYFVPSQHTENTDTLLSYLKGEPVPEDQHTSLAHSAIWFSIPSKTDIITAGFTGKTIKAW